MKSEILNIELMKANSRTINHPAIQMMINETIIRQDNAAHNDYLAKAPARRAYYYEKLHNLLPRVIHHLKAHKRDKKDPIAKELALSIQKELRILLESNRGLAEHYGLTPDHVVMLLQEL